MYITITPQKLGSNYLQSASDFVAYLEKENLHPDNQGTEYFFDQKSDFVAPKKVVQEIDGNTAKLKKIEPKFYSITINPSKRELRHLPDPARDLKAYTRELMKHYARSFHREIDGRKVGVDDLLYFAKVEHQRSFKGSDRAVRENAPHIAQIAKLQNDIAKIKRGELQGDISQKQKKILYLQQHVPHRQNGKMIVKGMPKEGPQAHVHIIISRKDRSNRFSLSPGSKYRASTVTMNGKTVKRGFDRDAFFKSSERAYDRMFAYPRNYVESYRARKTYSKDPKKYFAKLLGLPQSERAAALRLLGKSGAPLSVPRIPTNQAQLAFKLFKQLKKGIERAAQSSSIGI